MIDLLREKINLKENWDKVVILAVTIVLFSIVFLPFIINNSLDKYDTPGLLSLSWFIKENVFPDFSGWNPYFFAGFPQGVLYPPLFHYLVAILNHFFSLDISYKLLVSSFGLLVPYSVYYFSKNIYREKSWSVLSTLIILTLIIVTPGYFGFNVDGLVDYGLGPSFSTIPLFFFFWGSFFGKKKNFVLLAVLFSIMLLLNLVAPLFTILILLFYLFLKFKDRTEKLKIIKFVLLSFLLTSFWILPFLYFREYAVSGFPMKISSVFSLLIFIFIIFNSLLLYLFRKKTKKIEVFYSFLIPSIIIAFMVFIDSIINADETRFSLPFIHPFRLSIFSLLSVSIVLPFLIQSLHRYFLLIAGKLNVMQFFERKKHIAINMLILFLLIVFLIIFRIDPKGVGSIDLANDLSWEGRVIRGYKVSEVLDQSRAVIDRSILENPEDFGVDGLLKESSYLAPYFQSLSKSMDPENFDFNELDSYYIENYKLDKKKTRFLTDLMWVKSVFTISKEYPDCDVYKHLATFESLSYEEGIVERKMYICRYAPSRDSRFVSVIEDRPEVVNGDWERKLYEWWKSDDTQLFSDRRIEKFGKKDSDFEVSFSEGYQQMGISQGSNNSEKTIYVKMSYFPNWKAYDENGSQIEITRISPSFMAVEIDDEVTFKYERSNIEKITLTLSLLTWTGLIFYIIFKKFFIRNDVQIQ